MRWAANTCQIELGQLQPPPTVGKIEEKFWSRKTIQKPTSGKLAPTWMLMDEVAFFPADSPARTHQVDGGVVRLRSCPAEAAAAAASN